MKTFEENLLDKNEQVDMLVEKTIVKLIQIYENNGIEHIFDRGSVLGLADRIEKKADEYGVIG